MTCLSVEDNGEGISKTDIRQIFSKGFTGSSHHNGSYRSTGMGLYLTAKIIRQLGHQIRVESVYGSFTRFTSFLKKTLTFPPAVTDKKLPCSFRS